MANEAQVERLKGGVDEWNAWRKRGRIVRPDLRDAKLRGAKLRGADLRYANLGGADLCYAELSHADLFGATLCEADLSETDLSEANLRNASLRDALLTGADLSGANLCHARLWNAELRGADLSSANLQGARLNHANLCRANLSLANLSGADLRDANLQGADLCYANLFKARIGYANLSEASLNYADLSYAKLRDASLRGADLFSANLRHTLLTGADLNRSDLGHANLCRANLCYANLEGANLSEASLNQTNLGSASLRQADLTQSNLCYANLIGADLSHANLRNAQLTTEQQSGVGGGSYLDLGSCKGLETTTFETPNFLPEYLERAFHFAQREDTRDAERWSDFVEETLATIKALRSLQSSQDVPSPALTEALDVLNTQLLEYLKRHPEKLYEIPPDVFEQIVAEVLSSFGWQVDLTPKSKDGGYDLFAVSPEIRGGAKAPWIIECKRYAPHRKIDVSLVRALYGADAFREKQGCLKMLATTSFFTKDAWQMQSARYDLTLKDYGGVLEWINEYKPNPDGKLYLKGDRIVLK